MKILITGNEGFVGRHFEQYFKSKRDTVLGIDIKSKKDCRDFFKENTDVFDLVIHCAAIVGGREKIEGEPLIIATDLAIDADMFNWAVRTHQNRVVYFSSSAAYPISMQGIYRPQKLGESAIELDNIHNPDMTYGWTKLTGEMLAGFAKKQGINVHIIRPFSGYGADQDETYPFPSFIKRIKERQDPFIIWGDGEQVRDFIHIDDIIQGVLAVIEKDIQQPINMGTGRAISFNELALIMFRLANWTPNKIDHLLEKPVGVMYRVCQPDKFFSIYRPRISLEEGILEAFKK
jgi:nucleoside-diphosphate-sugar epimerase